MSGIIVNPEFHRAIDAAEAQHEAKRDGDRKAFSYELLSKPELQREHLLVLVHNWLMESVPHQQRERVLGLVVDDLPREAEARMMEAGQGVRGGCYRVAIRLASLGHVFYEQHVVFAIPRLMRIADVARTLEAGKVALQNACRELTLLEQGNDGFIRREDSDVKIAGLN